MYYILIWNIDLGKPKSEASKRKQVLFDIIKIDSLKDCLEEIPNKRVWMGLTDNWKNGQTFNWQLTNSRKLTDY